ncbi:MAG: glycosyltransferase, partial [Anaerolineales bacterium]
QGAKQAMGDFLLFLNNDTEILHPDWLTNLVGVISLPGVGAVGAKLIYPNGRVQHAGVVIGLEGHAAHVFQGISDDPFSPYGHVDWMRDVSAVTAACMLVRKEVFWDVGGFDEQFQIAFGDIDLCLRLRDKGYRIVYTPDSRLIHYEGRSRGKYIPAHDIHTKADYFLGKVAEGDPYYPSQLSRAYRIPTLRRRWEQDPAERLKKIIKILGS